MELAKPREEHHFLERLLGDWVVTSATGNEDCGPESPDDRWTETVRTFDGLWYVGESRGKMPDGRRGFRHDDARLRSARPATMSAPGSAR